MKKRSNPSMSGVSIALILAGIYLGWCGINYYQTKQWSWTPWKQLNLDSVKLLER